jgi:hypothetical protein
LTQDVLTDDNTIGNELKCHRNCQTCAVTRDSTDEKTFHLISNLLKKLAKETQEEQLVRDGNKEVNYFVFDDGRARKVYLVNTDWTRAGNVKKVRIRLCGKEFVVGAREGQVSSLECRNGTVVQT